MYALFPIRSTCYVLCRLNSNSQMYFALMLHEVSPCPCLEDKHYDDSDRIENKICDCKGYRTLLLLGPTQLCTPHSSIICTVVSVSKLSRARVWWMDGTFSARPQIFSQLYTIHVKIDNKFIQQLWCLLPDKQGATYTRLFQLLQQEARNINISK